MLAQELQRARARELRALRVVRAALVAVEAVARRVDEGLRARVLRRGLLRRFDRDRLIGLAPVERHRALRLFTGVVRDSAAVVAHGAGEAREAVRSIIVPTFVSRLVFFVKRTVYFVLWHNAPYTRSTPCPSPSSTTFSFARTTSSAPRISTARCSGSKSCRGPISRFPATGLESTARSRCIWRRRVCPTRSFTTLAARRTPRRTIPA